MMHMSDEEIIIRYKEAKDKRAQVNILADLNACDPDEIVGVLRRSGMDHRYLPRAPRKNKDKKEKKPKYFKLNKQKEEKNMSEEYVKITPETVIEDGAAKENDALTIQIARIQKENEELTANYNKAVENNVADAKRIQELSAKLKESRESADALSKLVEEKDTEIALLNEENDKMRSECDKLSVELHETEKELEEAQEQLETMKEKVKSFESDEDYSRLRDKYIYLEDEVRQLKNAIVRNFLRS